MLAAASLLQDPFASPPAKPSPSISQSASLKSNRHSRAAGGMEPGFNELMQQLAAQHNKEIQQLKVRLDLVQAENRSFKTRISTVTGTTGNRSSARASEFYMDTRITDNLSEVGDSMNPRDFEADSSSAPRQTTETAEVAQVVPDERTGWSATKTTSVRTTQASLMDGRTETEMLAGDESLALQPKPIELHDVWTKSSFGARSKGTTKTLGQRMHSSDRTNSIEELTIVGMTQGMMRHVIGNPTSAKRMAWDAVGGIMILYDITTLPLMVFEDVDSIATDILGWIVLVYWTLNVVNSLTCGYLQNGVAVMSPKAIFLRYVTRTIFVDLLTLVPDWTVTILQLNASPGQDFQEARLLRALRAFRLTRLVRIVKLRWLMEVLRDYLDSEYASIMFEIAKMMALLLVINHVLACAWFGLALLSSEIGWRDWRSSHVLDYGHGDSWWLYDYLTSLHWSLCQFTPASMEVQPSNPVERGFATLTVLFALIVFSYIVGSITGSLTQLRMMSEAITRETLKLRRFLRRNAVPIGLSLRIRRFVEFELRRRQQPVSQQSVSCLNVLSDQLQTELGFALVQPTLATHPIFETLMRSSGGSDLLERASQGFEKKTLALDDWEFLACTPATHMRYLVSGELRYAKQSGMLGDAEETDLLPGDSYWISEAVLWVSEWDHVGELTASLESNLLLISPDCILPWSILFPASHKFLKTYAQDFVKFYRTFKKCCWLFAAEAFEMPARSTLSDAAAAVEAAARRFESAQQKQFRLDVKLDIDDVSVALSDFQAPVVRAQLSTPSPAAQLHLQTMPPYFSVDIDISSLKVEVLNSVLRCWEPLLEPFAASVQVERRPDGEDGAGHAQQVVLTGKGLLLVNITPNMVKQTGFLLQLLSEAGSCQDQRGHRARVCWASGARYRAVNICEFPLELEVPGVQQTLTVPPTGSLWEPLDDWVLQSFATALRIRVPGGSFSRLLLLERAGDVLIPNGEAADAVAEMRIESSQRLLLLAPLLRVHNRTGFTVALRFLDPVQHEVPMLEIPQTACCDAAILGCIAQEEEPPGALRNNSEASEGGRIEGVLVLPPNSLGAVPWEVLARRRPSAEEGGSRTLRAWLTVQLLSDVASAKMQVGSGLGPQLCCASGTAGQQETAFVVEPQARHESLATTVCLRPALVFMNALPLGDLSIRYAPGAGDAEAADAQWQQASLERLSRRGVYDLQSLVEEVGLRLCLRLGAMAPWSEVLHIEANCFKQATDSSLMGVGKTTHVQQHEGDAGAAAGVLVEVCGQAEIRITCPFWFLDRSGIGKPLALSVLHGGKPLPHDKGVTMLPVNGLQEHCELLLRSEHDSLALLGLPSPSSWATLFWETPCGDFSFCLQVSDILETESGNIFSAGCQVITLRPRLVLTNASTLDIELCLEEHRRLRLAGDQSIEVHWRPREVHESSDSHATTLRFRPLREGCETAWSGSVVCGDVSAGLSAFAIPAGEDGQNETAEQDTWSVEVTPDRGALAVSFKQGSDYVARNLVQRSGAALSVQPAGCRHGQVVLPGQSMEYGWREPMASEFAGKEGATPLAVDVMVNGHRHHIQDARRSLHRQLPGTDSGLAICIFRADAKTVLALVEEGPVDAAASLEAPASWSQRVEIRLSRIGLSIIEAGRDPEELLYLQMELIRFELRRGSGEPQQLRLSVASAQVDCQLPGRADGRDVRRESSLGTLRRSPPAVIFAARGEEGRALLSLEVHQDTTSTKDLVIPYAEIALDSTDLTVDDHWLDRLARLASQARSASQSSKSALPDMLRLAGKPIVEEYVVPSCPRIVQIDALHISSIAVRVWCSIRLDSVRFLPGYVRSAIRLLSLSARFHLDGASVSLPRRRLPPYRGSVSDFLGCLAAEYTVNFLHNVGAVLGRSSVLKLPRVPLKLGGTAVSYVTDSIGLAAGEAAALLNKLTFDEDFVAKQREQQGTKRIRGLGDGVVEASKSIAQGVEGVMDVVKKPVQGARSSGLSGFLMGVGIGMAGSFVKPVSRVGQAISDVGSGLAAELAPDSGPTQRHHARMRKRQPRLFFSVPTSTTDLMDDAGPSHLRPFSDLEAATLHHLGSTRLRGLQEVVPLTTPQHGTQVAVLLLFGTHCLLADIPFHACQEAAEAKKTAASKRSGGASARLTAQALKPINTVVYGIQDLSRPSQSSARSEPDDTSQRQVRGFHFQDLTAVTELDDGRVIELHGDSISGTLALPLFSAPLGQASRDALVFGFRSALKDARIASWSTFSKTFRTEDQRSRLFESQGDAAAGAGLRKLVVWEVERRLPTASEWKTPFLPTDAGLTWRWVDTRGRRHPNLSLGLTRSQAAGSKTPPCRIGSLYRPTSDWQLEIGPETDRHGWSYGMAWNSSSWEAAPSPLEVLRRRRWTRTFT
ncbi:CNGA3 [Symbiodinium sp. CCMP2456]|nr:CNGA3 [Symbiodinium sp. CCMP2456]